LIFGLCTSVANGPKIKMCGSPLWMPPEMIQHRPHDYSADMWCLGMCLLELANRSHCPVPNAKQGSHGHISYMFTVATSGITSPFRDQKKWSPSFIDFISMCLQFIPSQRPSAEILLQHPFISHADTLEHISSILSCIFIQNVVNSIM